MDANAGGLRPLFRCDSAIFTFLTYPVLQCVAVGLCEAASFPSGDQVRCLLCERGEGCVFSACVVSVGGEYEVALWITFASGRRGCDCCRGCGWSS